MPKPSPRPAGRPRSLTLDRVLDEALAMGVDNIEMAPLAKRLGVAVGTLYSYVNSREHLIFQIASRHSDWAKVKDVGQSWQTVIREHAEITFTRLREWPQLIINLITGNAGTNFGVDARRSVVNLLTARGFSVKMANDLYFEANQSVLGAVVVAQYMDSTLSPLAQGKSSSEAFGIPAQFGRYEDGLDRLIAQYEARLG